MLWWQRIACLYAVPRACLVQIPPDTSFFQHTSQSFDDCWHSSWIEGNNNIFLNRRYVSLNIFFILKKSFTNLKKRGKYALFSQYLLFILLKNYFCICTDKVGYEFVFKIGNFFIRI